MLYKLVVVVHTHKLILKFDIDIFKVTSHLDLDLLWLLRPRTAA